MDKRDAQMVVQEELSAEHRSGFEAVAGKPNVGKSTLLNALLGQKIAIVSPKPQTTRTGIRGILTQSRVQVIFVDTPGIHDPRHKLGQFMVQTATQVIADSDVVLFLADISGPPSRGDHQLAKLISGLGGQQVILGLNKVDLLLPDRVRQRVEAYLALGQFNSWVVLSATRGDNLDLLLDRIIDALPLGPRYYPEDQITDQHLRMIVAELIREQVLRFTQQEIPHSVAVQVRLFEEREEGPIYIEAHIFVERESQKGIVIGRAGRMLRQIGREARREVERLLLQQV